MRLKTEIPWRKMRYKCDIKDLPYKSTNEIQPLEGIAGQDRAAESLQFGLAMNRQGYNIFVCGPNGTGKSTYVKTLVKEISAKQKTPDDWCYLYNFDEPDYPIAVNLPAGNGVVFKNDILQLINYLKDAIPKVFTNQQHEEVKDVIINNYLDKSNAMYDQLEKAAQAENFTITRTNNGLGSTPLIDGKALTEEEYDALPESEKGKWNESSKKIQQILNTFIKNHKTLEKEFKRQMKELGQEIGVEIAKQNFSSLNKKYKSYPKIFSYLNKLYEHVVKNIDVFLPKEDEATVLPLLRKDNDDSFRHYKVNLIVDNSQLVGAPMVVETTPSFQNIIGFMEYHGEFGAFTTDFSRIKRGALHLANGGYLILQIADVLKYPLVWDAIKKALINKEIKIDDLNKNLGLSITANLHPEPIPLDIKVILIGEPNLYYLLLKYDPDFSKLFKIKAEFDVEMENTEANLSKYASFIAALVKQNDLKPFTKTAIARIVEYGAEILSDQTRLSTRFNKIAEIVYEADQWAAIDDVKKVTGEYVNKAIKQKNLRVNQSEEKINNLIADGTILIDVTGNKVGEVNALAVYSMGDYAFGRPSKITAKTYMGRSGVINIEREADLSGNIHNKGVLILSGYLGDKFAKDKPLALTASLAFEQSYGGIDGDSASAAELIAIISSLADIPIKQNFAMTGSINQNGDIQPIGGVNEKIEGFFNICKMKSDSDQPGVIIPKKNIKNLMLGEEVIQAAKDSKFVVHAVSHVSEALYILTGVEPQKIYQLANERLNIWAKEVNSNKKKK